MVIVALVDKLPQQQRAVAVQAQLAATVQIQLLAQVQAAPAERARQIQLLVHQLLTPVAVAVVLTVVQVHQVELAAVAQATLVTQTEQRARQILVAVAVAHPLVDQAVELQAETVVQEL
jgi:hypothetical protein